MNFPPLHGFDVAELSTHAIVVVAVATATHASIGKKRPWQAVRPKCPTAHQFHRLRELLQDSGFGEDLVSAEIHVLAARHLVARTHMIVAEVALTPRFAVKNAGQTVAKQAGRGASGTDDIDNGDDDATRR